MFSPPTPGPDYGTTWVEQTGAGVPTGQAWTSVTASADFGQLVATAANGQVYESTDGGASWSATNSPSGNKSWSSVSSSGDGALLVAADQGGQLWVSTNGGSTWTAQTQPGANGVGNWTSVSVSKVR